MWHRHRDVHLRFRGGTASHPAASLGRSSGKRRTSRFGREPLRARTPSRGRLYTRRMVSVRFAPSPTRSLHLGNALSAVANRRLGDWMLLRIDDADPRRNVAGGVEEIVADLEWLGIAWDEGPVLQSERVERHLEAGSPLGHRFDGVTLVREDGTPTYQLASVVDDVDFGITHVVRGH